MNRQAGQRSARRARRGTDEVRQLLLAAAREMFETRGYAGASIRDIAARADVKESVLFRHFGSKTQLFEVAILEPLITFLEGYNRKWALEATTTTEVEVLVEEYLSGLYDVATENRPLILALVSARQFEPELFGEINQSSALASVFDKITDLVVMYQDAHRLKLPDPVVTTRATFALVMGMALLDEWLFPSGTTHPGRGRILSELISFQLHGVSHRE